MGLYERHICPHLVELALRSGWVHKQRKWLLEPVGGRVLEIGFGTGLNLQHYSSEVDLLVVLDPAEGMHDKAKRRIVGCSVPVESHQLDAETLPFEDESFDHVVCTFTLCTIPDAVAAVQQAHRVLRPGGQFHLIEHVGSERPGVRRWQDRLNPIQKVLGCGCNINRDMEPILERAGFSELELERIVQPQSPNIYREHVRGRARK